MGDTNETKMGCKSSREERIEEQKHTAEKLVIKREGELEAAKKENEELKKVLGQEGGWFSAAGREAQLRNSEQRIKNAALNLDTAKTTRVRGDLRDENMDVDPLANIVLDPVEQAKVNKIIVDNLKYLNLPEHNEDKKAIEDLFKRVDVDTSGTIDEAEFQSVYGTNANSKKMWATFDVDGNGNMSMGEMLAVIDNKYQEEPTKAAKWVSYLKNQAKKKF